MQLGPAAVPAFAAERGRPFHDLLARVPGPSDPSLVVDLGCGPGNLTRDPGRPLAAGAGSWASTPRRR